MGLQSEIDCSRSLLKDYPWPSREPWVPEARFPTGPPWCRAACENEVVGEAAVSRECRIDYGAGKLLDIYMPENLRGSVAVLFWHGSGANERDILEPLARRVAITGVGVITPDWSIDDGANGRNDLALSLSFAQNELAKFMVVDRIVLAGWSLGASAGLDVLLHPELVGGWRPAAFIGVSGGYRGSPFYQEEQKRFSVDPSVPLLLIHGSADEVVPVERSRITFEQLRGEGWSVTLQEVPTDHAGAIGTTYDPARHRCVPTADSSRLEMLEIVTALIGKLAQTG
jgi:pimeloyl-ACP methyl ester carboxylesterase